MGIDRDHNGRGYLANGARYGKSVNFVQAPFTLSQNNGPAFSRGRVWRAAPLHHAAATWPGGTPGSFLRLNGPSTFRALAHAPISSASSPNRYRTSPSTNRS